VAVLATTVVLFVAGGLPDPVRGVPFAPLFLIGCVAAIGGWVVLHLALARLGTVQAVRPGAQPAVPYLVVAAAAAVVGIAALFADAGLTHVSRHTAAWIGAFYGAAALAGAACRALAGPHGLTGQALMGGTLLTWAAYLDLQVANHPFRDAEIYLRAGRLFLDHQPIYLSAALASPPADPTSLPFLYPPFTLPLFAGLALLPQPLAIAIFELLCFAAVVAGLRLLGLRWPLVALFLFWPPIAIGVQVGNVACFGFLVLAAGWRAAATLPLAGVFKLQTGLLALWLVVERRWRSLAIGVAAGLGIVVLTLPLTGISAYQDWIGGLGFFQASLDRFAPMMGAALRQTLGPAGAAVVAGVVIVLALLGRRREGLARIAIAAVVASPTVYLHGLALLLPAILLLDGPSAWMMLWLATWGARWWGVAILVAALTLGLTRSRVLGRERSGVGPNRVGGTPGSETAAATAAAAALRPATDWRLHPLGQVLEPWPDAAATAAASAGRE
jgi:hypothetical protein